LKNAYTENSNNSIQIQKLILVSTNLIVGVICAGVAVPWIGAGAVAIVVSEEDTI